MVGHAVSMLMVMLPRFRSVCGAVRSRHLNGGWRGSREKNPRNSRVSFNVAGQLMAPQSKLPYVEGPNYSRLMRCTQRLKNRRKTTATTA